MRTIIFAALMVMSCGAMAGDYSDAVEKQSRCETAGELAMENHGIGVERFRAATGDTYQQEKAKKISSKVATSIRLLIWKGYSANSPREAYMSGWGWCMDQT